VVVKFGENMNKKDILKVIVLIVFAIFVVEIIAIGFFGRRGNTIGRKPSYDENIYYVRLNVDAELSSYGSYISVNTSSYSEVEAILMQNNQTASMISSMIDLSEASGKVLINLKDSSDAKTISDILFSHGYNLYTDINLKLPDTVALENITINTRGSSVKLKAPPIYEIGDNITINFNGYIQNYTLIHIVPETIYVHPVNKEVDITMKVKLINKIELNQKQWSILNSSEGNILEQNSYELNTSEQNISEQNQYKLIELQDLEQKLNKILNRTDYTLKEYDDTIILELNTTDKNALNDAVEVIKDLIDEFYPHDYPDDSQDNNLQDEIRYEVKTYARLYSKPVFEKAIYDPVIFNYPLPGLYSIDDEVDMKVTLSLDWGRIVDIKKAVLVN